jgi:hypothetical protein
MRMFVSVVGGVVYGLLLVAVSVIGLAGGGDGLIVLPGSLLGSPLVFLGPLGNLVPPVLWAAVAGLATNGGRRRQEWARLLLFLNYLGLPFAVLVTWYFGPRDWELLREHGDLARPGLIQLAVVYVMGQLWIWWLLLKNKRTSR